jgi:diketogulonate reductase-like aldo/keto reductase
MSPSLNLQSRVKLNDGAEIPRLGLGVYEMTDEET